MHKLVFVVVSMVFVLIACQPSVSTEPPQPPIPPHATIQDTTIALQPSGATFTIPQMWVEWFQRHGNNLHLTRAELEQVQVGVGEWDTQFGHIVNATLPFAQCSAHLGGEGWGADSVSYTDVQMRAYVGTWSLDQIRAQVEDAGVAAASTFSPEVSTDFTQQDAWQIHSLSFPLWFGDYGATAKLDFYARVVDQQTVVLVFMYSSLPEFQQQQINEITTSFAWHP